MVISPRGEPAAREARGTTELGLPPAFPPPRRGFAPCAAPALISPSDVAVAN
jgi:hypothetical protein